MCNSDNSNQAKSLSTQPLQTVQGMSNVQLSQQQSGSSLYLHSYLKLSKRCSISNSKNQQSGSRLPSQPLQTAIRMFNIQLRQQQWSSSPPSRPLSTECLLTRCCQLIHVILPRNWGFQHNKIKQKKHVQFFFLLNKKLYCHQRSSGNYSFAALNTWHHSEYVALVTLVFYSPSFIPAFCWRMLSLLLKRN